MDVILLQDVDNLGLSGQVVSVARGFARNKLIPGKFALEATSGNLKMLEKKRAEYEQRAMKEKDRAKQLAQTINKLRITIKQKAGEKDKLFGSVTNKDIAEALEAESVEIDRRKIKMAEPIKTLGDFDVPIRLHADVTANVKVSVVRDE